MDQYNCAGLHGANKIILVLRHKWSKNGPAMVGLDPENQDLMDTYLNTIRHKFAGDGVDEIFVKQDGDHFMPGTIGKHLTAFSAKSGMGQGGRRVAHTHVHKYIATKMQEFSPEMGGDCSGQGNESLEADG